MIDLSEQLDKGNLPYSGGVLEQPGKLYELINLVSIYKSNYRNIQQQQLSKQKK